MKKKWEMVKDKKARKVVLTKMHRQVLHDLNQVIIGATGNLDQLVKRYTRLPLSGSFTTQVASAVRLLEQKCKALIEHIQKRTILFAS